MASAGDEIVRSEHERITFLKTASDTNGEQVEVRVSYKPRSPMPPAHYHPYQEEHFEVASGVIKASIDGREATFYPGDAFAIPRGTVHWMHNVSEERGEVLWRTIPALRTEEFFETIWRLDGGENVDGSVANLLQMAVVLSEYQDKFRLARPPYPLQRILFGLLAPIGRALGVRSSSVG
jgi:quercetin dioxygenase-like cupin family protein